MACNPHVKALSLAAFIGCGGLLMIILACALDDNWWPFMVMLPFIFLPVPFIFCVPSSSMSDGVSGWLLLGEFLTGFLAATILAIPLVEIHVKAIDTKAVLLTEFGVVLTFSSVLGYLIWHKKHGSADSL
eukprot:TRINITY_DN10834_c0_g1_i1.p1 TRINITY_DN10834_c0_g1~~TRINITY_DN10834_c0_g1_i1.p1  ORF type:complete len:130 (+),score=18.81 TRINITY_DN10834_c0_g1_i1:85-474(+)